MSDQRICDPLQHHGNGDQPSQEVRVVHRQQVLPPLRARHVSLCEEPPPAPMEIAPGHEVGCFLYS